MEPLDESLRVSLAALGADIELDARALARIQGLWHRIPGEARASFGGLLYIELASERDQGASLDAACVLRAAERIAKRAQRELHARHARTSDVDVNEQQTEYVPGRPGALSGAQRAALWTAIGGGTSADELALLHKRFVDGRAVDDLAREYEISRSQMSRRLRSLLERLARVLGDSEP